MNGHWQCTRCHNSSVMDRVLSQVTGIIQLHRLTCESCGTVRHYDRILAQRDAIAAYAMETFRWVSDAERSPLEQSDQPEGGRDGIA